MSSTMNRWLMVSVLCLAMVDVVGVAVAAEDTGGAAVSPDQRRELEKAVDEVTFAIIEGDVATLMDLCQLKSSFQFDKKYYLEQFLKKRYSSSLWMVSSVEIVSIKMISDEEAKVMVKVHLSAVDTSGGLGAAPRAEVWKFVKGQDGPQRGQWVLLVDKS